ncbi:TonB-dependent receptor [Terriglobus sp. TAA 43]|uniref:TonB-dependent receptor n=1 Tax=Terriglobus sp. TAA 43 TaxID=278961 RepID=UPI000646E0FF|nr:TonB-dependent receptor [Terriglobus sp. TAA 43]
MKHLSKLSLVACLAAGSVAAMAQVQNGTITGTITDTTGALVPDAAVTISSKATGLVLHVQSNKSGLYTAPQLIPGTYTVTVERPGFQKTISTLDLTVGQTAQVDLALKVGNENETVDVSAENAAALDSQTSNLDFTVQSKQVDNLPLNGRNPYGLAVLAPGIAPGNNFGVGVTVARGAVVAAATNNFQSNGGLGGSNEILLDGVSLVVCCQGQPAVTPSVEFVNQFKVVTSSAPAQYGRSSGAVLNIVSKSGTNSLHGDVYEFLRNDKLDAANYFTKRNGVYPYPGHKDFRPPHRANQYGVLLTGPVYIPKIYNGKDRTFFTFNYEAIRNLAPGVGNTTVPTALMRQGIFTEGSTPIYDPNSSNSNTQDRTPIAAASCGGTAYAAGYCIPVSTWNPVAAKYLQYMPAPNIAGAALGANNYTYIANTTSKDDQYNFRIDQNIGSSHRLFVRGTRSKNLYTNNDNFNSPTGPGGWTQTLGAYLFAVGDVYTVSSNKIVQVSYGFARQTNLQLGNNFYNYNAGDYGYSSNLLGQQQIAGLPVASFTNLAQIGFQSSFNNWAHYTHSLNGTLLWTHGKHTITTGYQGRLNMEMQSGLGNPNGAFSFGTTFTGAVRPGGTVAGTQQALASWATFLLGYPTGGSLQRQLTQAFNQFAHGFFVQDDWRITPNLTINAGVRYDLETGFKDRRNAWADFDPTAANPIGVAGGAQFLGAGNNPSRTWATSYKEFAPRLGMSWAATPTTVFRGGYGLLFLPTSERGYSNPNIGFSQSTSIPTSATGFTPVVKTDNPFTSGVLLPAGASAGSQVSNGTSISGLQYHNPVSYQQQWNFGVQQGLGNTFTLQLNYVGGHGVHLPMNVRYNDLQPQYFLPVGTTDFTPLTKQVANPFFGNQYVIAPGVLKNATVQQVQLNARFPQYTSGAINSLQNNTANVSYQDIGSTTYNAMQATVSIHRPNGVTGSVSYVWSKLLGNVSDLTNGFLNTTGNPNYQNFYFPQYEHSTLATDLRHRIVGTANYALPVGRGKRFGGDMPRWADMIVGGWEVNTIIQVSSGNPLSMGVSGTGNWAGTRPMYNSGVRPLNGGGTKSHIYVSGGTAIPYLNPAAFTLPTSFQLGNVPRSWSAIRGPLNFSNDASVVKRFVIHDQVGLELRAEAFNVLNKVQFSNPNATVNSGVTTFGFITSQANLPRNVQIAAKLRF